VCTSGFRLKACFQDISHFRHWRRSEEHPKEKMPIPDNLTTTGYLMLGSRPGKVALKCNAIISEAGSQSIPWITAQLLFKT